MKKKIHERISFSTIRNEIKLLKFYKEVRTIIKRNMTTQQLYLTTETQHTVRRNNL